MRLNPRSDPASQAESASSGEAEWTGGGASVSLALSDLFSALFLILIALSVVALIQLQEAKREQQTLARHIREQLGVYQGVIDRITQMRERLAQEHIPVEVNPKTGEVIIRDDGVMFAVKSARLSLVAQRFLRRFARVYFDVILADSFVEEIRWIVVEGHASAEGEEVLNLELSAQRAHAVSAFLLKTLAEAASSSVRGGQELSSCQSEACARLTRLKDRLLVAGRGEFSAQRQVSARDRSVRFRLHFTSDLFDLYEDEETKRIILAPHR